MSHLSMIERVIDELDQIDETAIAAHFEAVQAVDQKTDALISFMKRMKMEAAEACARADAWKERAKRCEAALERCENYAKHLLRQFPDLTFRGKHGKLAIQKNPPALKLNSISTKPVTLKVILLEDVVVVPERFRIKKECWVLNTDEIKKAIKNGEYVGFADLEQGESLRIKI